MMNLGISTFGCDGGRSGIGRYAVNVIQQLARMPGSANCHLYVGEDESNVFAGEESASVTREAFPRWIHHPAVNIAWHQLALGRDCRRRKHDVLFLPAGNRRLPLHVPCPTVGTVHDFSSFHVQGKYDPARMLYIKQVLPLLIRRLTHVLTVSESSKRDIVRYAGVDPDRITVTPLAVDHARYVRDPQESRERIREQFSIDRPYLLYVSRIEHPGKNHLRLIEAFERLRSRARFPHRLVLAGGDWSGAKTVHQRAAASRYAEDILFTGYVTDDHLIDLYTCADVMVFPSLYEGFGLPLLEAMTCGVPVACGDVSSLPEVGGEAATYFSPDQPDQICDAMECLLEDQRYRSEKVALGRSRSQQFTWTATAEGTFDVLQRAAQLDPALPQSVSLNV